MEWSKYDDGNKLVETWTSDATGHHETSASWCGCLNFVIQAEVPPGYRLTTDDRTSFGFAPP